MADAQAIAIAKDLGLVAGKTVGLISASIMTELNDDTPVDTGFAASNWVASFGNPNVSVYGSKEAVSEGRFSATRAECLSWIVGRGNIYITNSVVYIGKLNEGWSRQAPANFVDKAINLAIVALNGLKIIV